MEKQKEQKENIPSVYDLLKGRLLFTTEPPRVRVMLFIIMVAFFLMLAWILKGVTVGIVVCHLLGDKWKNWFNFLRQKVR